jgi:hypothetical protein
MAPFKVFVKRGDYEVKFGVPKSWRDGPVHKLLEVFLSAFNEKFADATLDAAAVHLRTSEGVVLASAEKLEIFVTHNTRLIVADGPAPEATVNPLASTKPPTAAGPGGAAATVAAAAAAAAAAKPATEAELMRAKGWLKCKNYGCQTWYDPAANEEGEPACRHHVAPPMFHDTKKGWTCCRDRLVYDWADFELIEGCTAGRHSQTDPGVKFQKSPTIAAAEAAEATVRCCRIAIGEGSVPCLDARARGRMPRWQALAQRLRAARTIEPACMRLSRSHVFA